MDIREKARRCADILTQKLGFDIRFYGKTFSLYSLSYGTTVLRGIASTYLVTLWVDPEILGKFRYVLAIYSLAGMFSFGGYGTAVIKGLARGESSIVAHVFKKIIRYTPLGTLLLLLSALDRLLQHETDTAIAMTIAAIAFVPYTLCSFYNQIYIGLEKIKRLTVVSVWSDTLYAILFTLVLLKTHNLVIITIAYFLIDILIQGWFTLKAYRSIPHTTTETSNDAILPLGTHLNWIYIMQGITNSLGAILLQRYWGYATLAAFSVAMLLPEQFINLAKIMSGTILQRLSRKEENPKSIQNIQKQFRFILLGSIVAFLLYAAIAPFVIPILFPRYATAVLPSIIYALGIIAIPSLIGVNYFQAHSNFSRIWKYYISLSILQLVTSFVFIPFFGNWGAIWSRVVTRVGALPFGYPQKDSVSKR